MKRVISFVSILVMAGGLLLGPLASGAPIGTVPASRADDLTTRVFLPLVMRQARRPTSNKLIDQALARGEIDSDTALTYKVFAAFGDDRLPSCYRGDDWSVVDSHIVAEVQYRYADLSAATQAILNPFLIPPAYEGSWAQPLPATAGLAPQAVRWEPPPCGALAWPDWTYKDGVHARVWWRKAYKEHEAKADAFIANLDGWIWPWLTGLMGHEPLPDGLVSCSGGSDKLDVYLDPSIKAAFAPAHNQPGCAETPAYILLNPDETRSTLAHEFMHTIQWRYKPAYGCVYPGEYAWLAEATATWAEHYTYPKDNTEHGLAPWFFQPTPEPYLELTNKEHEYGAYIFFLYLTQTLENEGLVKTVWDNTVRMDSLKAVNEAIPGGFKAVWANFARENVNMPPYNSYQTSDGLVVHPQSFDGWEPVTGAVEWPMNADVPHLGLVYQRFTFTGEKARLVTFLNGWTKRLSEGPLDDMVGLTQIDDGTQKYVFSDRPAEQIKGAAIQAVFKIEGDDQWKWEDWTDKRWVSFCRDVKAERLEQLFIIMSNSEYENRGYWVSPLDYLPTIMVSDMGCWRYQGSASVELSGQGDSGSFKDLQWVDNLVFERTEAHPNIPYPFQTLLVQGGQWHRTFTLRGECTADASVSKTLGGVVRIDKSLWTITGASSGPSVGRYLGLATANQDIPVLVICPGGSGVFTYPDEPYFNPTVVGEVVDTVFTAEVGGAINATVTFQADAGKYEHKWALTPQREP